MKAEFFPCLLRRIEPRVTFPAGILICFYLFGCALDHDSKSSKSKLAIHTPEQFLNKAGSANLVFVTDAFTGEMEKWKPINLKIQGQDATNFIAAIQKVKAGRDEMGIIDTLFIPVTFYRGTNYLATAGIHNSAFQCEDGLFYDQTGVIENVYEMCSQLRDARQREWDEKVVMPKIYESIRQKTSSTNF